MTFAFKVLHYHIITWSCSQLLTVYDGPWPFVDPTFEPTTVNLISENSTVNLTSEAGTAVMPSGLTIQLAVGVPVGVVSAVVLFAVVVMFACCVKEVKQREKG